MESLPTGIVISSSGHNSIPMAFTVWYSFSSSPGWPAAHIQLADILISDSFSMLAAAMLVTASPTDIRPEAGALIKAIGVRSPIAIASPTKES